MAAIVPQTIFQELDGSPSGQFAIVKLPNGTLTDNGDGTATLAAGLGGVSSITGTANQVIASASTGGITLSLPQSIATSSTPQFARLGLGAAASGSIPLIITNVSTSMTNEQFRINRTTPSTDTQSINFAGGASFDFLFGRSANTDDLVFGTNGGGGFVERFRMTTGPNFKIGGSASRGTTEGSNQLVLFNGTAPVGTLTNGGSIYAASGELRAMDAAGNSSLLSPHDHETNEWIYYSKNTITGKVLRVDMERMMKLLDEQLGGGYVKEYVEEIELEDESSASAESVSASPFKILSEETIKPSNFK